MNEALRRAAAQRREREWETKILVINEGGEPLVHQQKVIELTGLESGSVYVDIDGLPDAVTGDAWQEWRA